jgi:MFS family permease
VSHLLHLLRGTWFRRLFAVRCTSQLTDGVFQVALASYLVFAPEHAPNAAAIASALAVVLLPFSVLGPFVGVFLDRWRRRQILAWSNFARVALAALLAVAVHAGLRGAVFLALALVCLSVNRFLLAGLSASLPHVVSRDDLVTANSLTPTAGTLAFLIGLALGAAARPGWARLGVGGDVGVLLTAAVLYAVAGGLALRMPRDLLGPDLAAAPPRLLDAIGDVARGLGEGLRHLHERRPAARGLAVVGAQRFCYGVFTVSMVLLYRNYFHGPGQTDAAFADLSVAVLVSGVGFVAAAVVTPVVLRLVTARTWVLAMLATAAVVTVFPGLLFRRPGVLVAALLLGLASQGIKIVVDTVVQTHVDDRFRGRVFALYDVIFNVAFVAAAAAGAVVLPDTGRAPVVLVALAMGYALRGWWYAASARRPA